MRNEIFLSLLLGFLLDCLVGDPHSIPHPVVLIGKLISALEKGLRKLFPKTRAGEMTAGGFCGCSPWQRASACLWGCCISAAWSAPGCGWRSAP